MRIELLRRRAQFIQAIRRFFVDRGYLEVETPILAPFLIPEPSLEIFETTYLDAGGGARVLYLIPSPELWMKRLLAAGSGSIFQITKCFRNGESLERYHNPEFTMLEWYTVDHDYTDSMGVMEDLVRRLGEEMTVDSGLLPPFRRMAMNEAFETTTGLKLDHLMSLDAILEAARSLGIRPGGG